MKLLVRLAVFAAGFATATATVLLHDMTWALILAWVATVLTVYALPVGLRGRIPYATGWMLTMTLAVWPRPAGGYLLGSSVSGYAVLFLSLVTLSVAIATLPLKRRRRFAGHDQPERHPDHLTG